eukprot:10693619-Karenia_brevis.AAC.1
MVQHAVTPLLELAWDIRNNFEWQFRTIKCCRIMLDFISLATQCFEPSILEDGAEQLTQLLTGYLELIR